MTEKTISDAHLVAWLDAAITRREQTARAVGWEQIETVDYLWGTKHLILRRGDEAKATTEMDAELAEHVALNDPQDVLRRCEADRRSLRAYAATVEARNRHRDRIQAARDRGEIPAEGDVAAWREESSMLAVLVGPMLNMAQGYGWSDGDAS